MAHSTSDKFWLSQLLSCYICQMNAKMSGLLLFSFTQKQKQFTSSRDHDRPNMIVQNSAFLRIKVSNLHLGLS